MFWRIPLTALAYDELVRVHGEEATSRFFVRLSYVR